MSEQRKAVIKNADMSEDMQQDAVDCACQAISKYNIEKVRIWNPRGIQWREVIEWRISRTRKSLDSMVPIQSILTKFCLPDFDTVRFRIQTELWSSNTNNTLTSQDIAAYIKKEFDKKYNPTWWVLAIGSIITATFIALECVSNSERVYSNHLI